MAASDLLSLEMGGDGEEYLKVNTRDGALEYGDILLVKEVINRTLNR